MQKSLSQCLIPAANNDLNPGFYKTACMGYNGFILRDDQYITESEPIMPQTFIIDNASSKKTANIRKGFIMAAGKGSRFTPNSKTIPKTLFSVCGQTLLELNARQLDRAFDLDVLYFVAGHQKGLICDAVEKISGLNARTRVIDSKNFHFQGLLTGFAAIADHVEPEEPFVCVLGDEFYGGDDHEAFAGFVQGLDFSVVCAIKRCLYPDECKRNYAVAYENNRISGVREKPSKMDFDFFGLGLIAAKGELAKLAKTRCSQKSTLSPYELINDFMKKDAAVYGHEFFDMYVNVNRPEHLDLAKDRFHKKHWDSFSIDVVIPALNEEKSIGYVVRDFKRVCANVIVMDNFSTDNTAQKAADAGAIVHSLSMEGYGDALLKGMEKSDADIIAMAEADGTFRADDLQKLLEHLKSADAVIGARTCKCLIQKGAFMPFLLRMGNIAVGLLISVLWWRSRLRFTDAGCTLRAMWRQTFETIRPGLGGKGPEFAPEVIVELLSKGQRVIEIPVSYYPRMAGDSKLSGNYLNSAKTALRMLVLIALKRLTS